MLQQVLGIVRSGRFMDLGGGIDPTRLALDRLVLDHVGVAVRSLDDAATLCDALGLKMTSVETVASEAVRVGMVPLGSARLELLEGIGVDSVVSRFVARRGDGLHHVALRVHRLDSIFVRLGAQGVRLTATRIQVGAGGHRYLFVHPAETGGVLVELVEDKIEAGL